MKKSDSCGIGLKMRKDSIKIKESAESRPALAGLQEFIPRKSVLRGLYS
ncbi:hypothetical protein MR798_05365 [bacterium]|nr:hypothetical protein [bacterium]